MPQPGANTTDLTAHAIHGTDPQLLIEKITRTKIRESNYWKEHCFALTAESLVDKAVDLKYVGGTYGGANKPTEFMCLVLKMLQIQPEMEIVTEFIRQSNFKYVRVLGAFYLRLVAKPREIYVYLESMLSDFRKIRMRQNDGKYKVSTVDVIVDALLREDYYFDIGRK
jgi:pre-mRNA-splicing factor 38A